MGRQTKIKHDRFQNSFVKYDARLKQFRDDYFPTPQEIATKIIGEDSRRIVRPLSTWVAPKTKDLNKITLSIARHLFGKYRTPSHLEAVWFNFHIKTVTYNKDCRFEKSFDQKPGDFTHFNKVREWFLTVATGESLHKKHTKDFLSRKETHLFLNPPIKMEFNESMWYAVARSYTDNHGIALRVAKSKISTKNVETFWKEVSRFFCTNINVKIEEINDLCDYLESRHLENKNYSLKGRTIETLKIQQEKWHRALVRSKTVCGGHWEGLCSPSWKHEKNNVYGEKETWTMTQIKSGDDLFKEGSAMHHCVTSYKSRCISGYCSIWSLKKSTNGKEKRILTIEVSNDTMRIVQVRGFGNRYATGEEDAIVFKWSKDAGLMY